MQLPVAFAETFTCSLVCRRTPETQTPQRPDLLLVTRAVRVRPAAVILTVSRLRQPFAIEPRTRTREPLRDTDEILSFAAIEDPPAPGVGVGPDCGVPGGPGVGVGTGGVVGVGVDEGGFVATTACAAVEAALPAAS